MISDKEWEHLFFVASTACYRCDQKNGGVGELDVYEQATHLAKHSYELMIDRFPDRQYFTIGKNFDIDLSRMIHDYISWIERKTDIEKGVFEIGFKGLFVSKIYSSFIENGMETVNNFEIIEGMKEMLRNE